MSSAGAARITRKSATAASSLSTEHSWLQLFVPSGQINIGFFMAKKIGQRKDQKEEKCWYLTYRQDQSVSGAEAQVDRFKQARRRRPWNEEVDQRIAWSHASGVERDPSKFESPPSARRPVRNIIVTLSGGRAIPLGPHLRPSTRPRVSPRLTSRSRPAPRAAGSEPDAKPARSCCRATPRTPCGRRSASR